MRRDCGRRYARPVDERTRRLRRTAETGDPGVDAALVAARLRSGEVSRWTLRLAAWAGSPVACDALGEQHHEAQTIAGLTSWLSTWGGSDDESHMAGVRLAVAAVRAVLARAGTLRGRAGLRAAVEAEARRAADAAAAWAVCPCASHARAAGLAAVGLDVEGRTVAAASVLSPPGRLGALMDGATLAAASAWWAQRRLTRKPSHRGCPALAVEAAARAIGAPLVLDAVRVEATRWALGPDDQAAPLAPPARGPRPRSVPFEGRRSRALPW